MNIEMTTCDKCGAHKHVQDRCVWCDIADAVRAGWTLTIGPHKEAPCGVFLTNGERKFSGGDAIDARKIRMIVEQIHSATNAIPWSHIKEVKASRYEVGEQGYGVDLGMK